MQDSHVRRLIGQCRTVILVHGTISMKVVLIGNCKKISIANIVLIKNTIISTHRNLVTQSYSGSSQSLVPPPLPCCGCGLHFILTTALLNLWYLCHDNEICILDRQVSLCNARFPQLKSWSFKHD